MNRKFKEMRMAIIGIGAALCVAIPVVISNGNKSEETNKMNFNTVEGILAHKESIDNIIIEKNLKENTKDILSPVWNLEMAKISYDNNDKELGDKYLTKALAGEYIESEVANEIVLTYFFNGEYYKSLEVGEKLLNKYEDDIQLHKTMIMVYLYNGVKDRATDIINKLGVSVNYNLSLLNPVGEYKTLSPTKKSQKLAELAEMYYLIGDVERAIETLEKAWNYDYDNYKVYDVLARMATDNKDNILKIISRRQVNAQKEQYNENKIVYNENMYKMWVAKIYSLSAKSADDAIYLISKLEGKYKDSINLKRTKAVTLLLNGNTEEAMEELDKLLNEHENDFTAHYTAAIMHFKNENYEDALVEAQKTLELNKDYEDVYGVLLPKIHTEMGELEDIDKFFKKGIEKNPISVSNIIFMGSYYYKNKEIEKAIYYYDLAKAISPNNFELRYKIASAYISMAKQDSERAKEYYSNALKSVFKSIELTENEPMPKYYRMASNLYMQLGDSEKAYKYIRKAYYLDEDDIITLNNAGVFHILMNDDTFEEDENDDRIQKGLYNLMKAYQGINDDYDSEVIDIITKNYNIGKEFSEKFINADDNAVLELPKGFMLLY
ncbi:tetratricopeptide repeat protein [Oceanirhabdus sp. W0125-5]|uniref:tetratricopeptide repeat protein n=1 Tax=Oceanirhabdus sp. W0125-5 TaxID=2999116 RepID=UPI0022F2DA10|nr:hypothetical protein [Oceanirhabdus sp. W0125-5]WBW98697.1 hypothetical protein OW730_08040 [Oceanirhabdus sp. W0125-5]